MNKDEKTLLEIKNLGKYFPTKGMKGPGVQAVQDVSLFIRKGETLGLVGEPGYDKTTLGRTISRLREPTDGTVIYDGGPIYDNPFDSEGKSVGKAVMASMLPYRRKMQIIFQDPSTSLDPHMTVSEIVGEAVDIHKLVSNKGDRADMVKEPLRKMGLDAEHGDRYPYEFLGGQQQRVGITYALAAKLEPIVRGKPISALDVSIQSQMANMLEDMQEGMGLTYLFIVHDLSVMRHISNRIDVMYLGSLVELSESYELNQNPIHSYTKILSSAVPVPDPEFSRTHQGIMLEGDIPDPANLPSGCRSHTGHPCVTGKCSVETPILKEHEPGRWTARRLSNERKL